MVAWTHVMTSFFPSGFGNAGQLLFAFLYIFVPLPAINLSKLHRASTTAHHHHHHHLDHLATLQLCTDVLHRLWGIHDHAALMFLFISSRAVHMFSTGSEQEVICFHWKCHKALDYIRLCINPVLC